MVCFIKPPTKTVSKISRSFLSFFLLFGTLFVPLRTVEAGFFSSLLGGEAHAENVGLNPSSLSEDVYNSQNIALLEANVTSASILEGKSPKKDDKKGDAGKSIDTNLNINIVSDTSLLPSTGPMGVFDGKGTPDFTAEDMSVYVVRKGDSISQIADMFGVSANTILWANDMKKGAKLAEGDILLILPISGIKHQVVKGETLQGIAKRYKVDTLTITSFNGIDADAKLAIGDELLIPDAEMPTDDIPSPTPKKGSTIQSTLKNIAGYFINPVPELKRKSQGPHGPGNRGVDLAAPTGTRILASAGGTVIFARIGYNGGYGNMVTIQHPNGTKTLYAHMSRITTKIGAQVARGELIGHVGSTGRSTGPHLHFEVFNAKNPGSDWSWATR